MTSSMVKTTVCDLCKKDSHTYNTEQYDFPPLWVTISLNVWDSTHTLPINSLKQVEKEICGDCQTKILNFFNGDNIEERPEKEENK